MISALDIDRDIAPSAHANGFFRVLKRMPAVVAEIFSLAVYLLDVDILRVAVKGCESPGNVVIAPRSDKRYARDSDPGHVKVSRFQTDFVPDIRNSVLKMHVI